ASRCRRIATLSRDLVILAEKSGMYSLEAALGFYLRREPHIQSGRTWISFGLVEDLCARGPFEPVCVPAGEHRHLANCPGEHEPQAARQTERPGLRGVERC